MTLRLAVTGVQGQLASALARLSAREGTFEVSLMGRPSADIRDGLAVIDAVRAARPDVVVNAAAYTAVDRAEDEPDVARAVNTDGARNVARAAAALSVPVFQVSTDYVYPGSKDAPYLETDATGPLGVYGETKLAGEIAVAAENERYLVLRTAWVHSASGANFVRTMLRLAVDRPAVNVVADQFGCPTQADHLSAAIVELARVFRDMRPAQSGILHVAGDGETSWAGLAEEVFARSRLLGGPSAAVVPIPTSAYPTRAARPANSRLDTGKLAGILGRRLPHWRDGVALSVSGLLGKQSS